jgi:hypothetical protein
MQRFTPGKNTYSQANIENSPKFTDSYKRIRMVYIDSARKHPEEFVKRLNHFIRQTRDNKQIKSFGGIEEFY